MEKSKVYNSAKMLGVFLVLLGHSIETTQRLTNVSDSFRVLQIIYNFIYSFHMPFFAMISGLVYGYCIEIGKYSDTKKFIVNKAKRLLVPYLFWGVFLIAPIQVYLFRSDNIIHFIWRNIIQGYACAHLWFLVFLFWCFCIMAIFRNVIKKHEYTLYIMLVVSIVLRVTLYAQMDGLFIFNQVIGKFCFFVLGVIINNNWDGIKRICARRWLLHIMIGTAIAFVAVSAIINRMGNIATWIGILGFLGCSCYIKSCPIVTKNSMGIYLIHVIILKIIEFFVQKTSVSPYLVTVIIFSVIAIFSLLISEMIRRIHLGVLIGERKV